MCAGFKRFPVGLQTAWENKSKQIVSYVNKCFYYILLFNYIKKKEGKTNEILKANSGDKLIVN